MSSDFLASLSSQEYAANNAQNKYESFESRVLTKFLKFFGANGVVIAGVRDACGGRISCEELNDRVSVHKLGVCRPPKQRTFEREVQTLLSPSRFQAAEIISTLLDVEESWPGFPVIVITRYTGSNRDYVAHNLGYHTLQDGEFAVMREMGGRVITLQKFDEFMRWYINDIQFNPRDLYL